MSIDFPLMGPSNGLDLPITTMSGQTPEDFARRFPDHKWHFIMVHEANRLPSKFADDSNELVLVMDRMLRVHPPGILPVLLLSPEEETYGWSMINRVIWAE